MFEWANLLSGKYPELKLMYHIPNGGIRNPVTAYRLKLQGVLAGVCDIHLPIPKGKYHSLYLELKAKYNKLTEKQRWFIDEMNRYGHYACVAYGLDEAIKVIEWYLNI